MPRPNFITVIQCPICNARFLPNHKHKCYPFRVGDQDMWRLHYEHLDNDLDISDDNSLNTIHASSAKRAAEKWVHIFEDEAGVYDRNDDCKYFEVTAQNMQLNDTERTFNIAVIYNNETDYKIEEA